MYLSPLLSVNFQVKSALSVHDADMHVATRAPTRAKRIDLVYMIGIGMLALVVVPFYASVQTINVGS